MTQPPNSIRGILLGAVSALEGLNVDLGGLKVGFSATSHQGAKDVFLTVARGGKAVQVDKL